MKTAKRMARLVSYLPLSVQGWIIKTLRAPKPNAKQCKGRQIKVEMAAEVPVVWINPGRAPRGTLVMSHGGGYIDGPFEQNWDWLIALCERLGFAGLMIDYRTGRQAPYPAAPDDVTSVIRHYTDEGVLADKNWSLIGDSAGGGLALVVCRRLLDSAAAEPACLVLISPFVDMRLEHPEIDGLQKLDLTVNRTLIRKSIGMYAPGEDLANPELSPTEANLTGMPPVHLRVGTHEIFLPDIRLYADKLRSAGIPLDYEEEPEAIHIYPMMVDAEEAQRAIASQVAFVADNMGIVVRE